jgi:retron-type reverse transcriptase
MEIIENKIKDRRFTKLIRKALKAGYLTFGRHKINIVASREGSIVSPILANIFLHQLDLFVLSLKESLEQRILGKKAPISKASRY